MKVAVSIPDAVFEAAEELAARRRCSRSNLYTEALERFLADAEDDNVTVRLDAVYAEESSGLDDTLKQAQADALSDSW
ncbi:MAG: ChpI protein [Acidimicrobiia bacterium]|nr:ChpI protein [Acidimicrobiia bacterium]